MSRLAVFSPFVLLLSISSSYAQNSQKMDAAELNNTVYAVSQRKFPVSPGTFRVTGERHWDGFFLSADKIEFDPGAKLIFSPKSMQYGDELFIVTREITSLSQENPGQILYESVDDTKASPPNNGSAPAAGGYPGDGNTGFPGGNGLSGNPGYRGTSAPHITLVSEKITGPLVVVLPGITGGIGGKGQAGGKGGVGGNGRPASQNCCNCKHGAGNGARGGTGGAGGTGGTGGSGGNGGTFTLVTSDDNYASATSLIRSDVSFGKGGPNGQGGDPGPGGDGGQGGAQSLPWCRGNGSPGPMGTPGSVGGPGAVGTDGAPGVFLAGSISTSSIDKIVGYKN